MRKAYSGSNGREAPAMPGKAQPERNKTIKKTGQMMMGGRPASLFYKHRQYFFRKKPFTLLAIGYQGFCCCLVNIKACGRLK